MNKFKIILHSGLIGLLGYLFIGLFLTTASGQSMSNQDYIIQTEDVNITSETPSQNNNPAPIKNKPSNITSEGVNFIVKTGFENTPKASPFSASLSSDAIDFGSLTPTNPIIRTVNLGILNPPKHGYSVIAFENHALQKDPDATGPKIEDVTCDSGECSHEIAGIWTNALTYGFGYNSSLADSNSYKHFANVSNSESPQSVITETASNNKEVILSYKVNISNTHSSGIYTNTITYIAVPNY